MFSLDAATKEGMASGTPSTPWPPPAAKGFPRPSTLPPSPNQPHHQQARVRRRSRTAEAHASRADQDRIRSDEGSPGPPRAMTCAHRDLAARAAEGNRPTSPTSTPRRRRSAVRTSEAAASEPTSTRHPTRRPPSSVAAPEEGTPRGPYSRRRQARSRRRRHRAGFARRRPPAAAGGEEGGGVGSAAARVGRPGRPRGGDTGLRPRWLCHNLSLYRLQKIDRLGLVQRNGQRGNKRWFL